ncbi:MAG: AraC family transcriptional regulator [Gemmatimonadaceae bacterium]
MRSVNAETLPRYHGHTWRTVDLDGLRLTENRHVAGARIGRHSHALPYATVVIEGGYEEKTAKSSHTCTAGSVVFHEPGERHANRFGTRDTKLVNLTWIDPVLVPCFGVLAMSSGRAARRLSVELASEIADADATSPAVIESLAAEVAVLGAVSGSAGPDIPGWLREVEERLRDEYLKPPALGDLARDAGVHRSHLARTFRSYFRRSVGSFVRELRLDWSAERLRRGAPIVEVALGAGFSDQSHMTRWFRRSRGLTPRAFVKARTSVRRSHE